MKPTLIFLAALLETAALGADGERLYVVVTAGTGNGFRCQLGTESMPAPVVQGYVRLKVSVGGGRHRGPFRWRLPLYSLSNGANDIAAAQVGVGKPDGDGVFFLDVPVDELDRAAKDQLRLEVTAKDGARANCSARVSYSENITTTTSAADLKPTRAEAR